MKKGADRTAEVRSGACRSERGKRENSITRKVIRQAVSSGRVSGRRPLARTEYVSTRRGPYGDVWIKLGGITKLSS